MRVVLDTVVFVRALINPKGRWGRLLFEHADKYVIVLSPEIVKEILDVINRQELHRRFPEMAEMPRMGLVLSQTRGGRGCRTTGAPRSMPGSKRQQVLRVRRRSACRLHRERRQGHPCGDLLPGHQDGLCCRVPHHFVSQLLSSTSSAAIAASWCSDVVETRRGFGQSLADREESDRCITARQVVSTRLRERP